MAKLTLPVYNHVSTCKSTIATYKNCLNGNFELKSYCEIKLNTHTHMQTDSSNHVLCTHLSDINILWKIAT